MKKIFLIPVLLFMLHVGWAQVSKNLKSSSANNHPVTQNQNVQSNATNHVVQQGALIPVPKKIASFSSKRSLNLVSSSFSSGTTMYLPTSNTSTATSRPADQKQKMIQAGILGIVSKNINGVKTGFVLTNKTSGWGATTNFSKNSKPKGQDNSNQAMNCVVSDETLTAQSTSFLNANKNEQGQHLYPGAIYTFDDYANGNFKPFETGRNPVEVITNATGVNGGGSISQSVQNPIQSAIRQAVSDLVSRFSPSQGGGTVVQQTIYTNNLSEFSITVSGGGAYDGYSGSDFYSHNQSENHIYISIDATKILYTMSVPKPANGLFANGQIPQANSPLVMVQDVSYGARILANMDFTISSNTNLDKFKFNYDAPTANAFFDLNAMIHDSTVNYTINSYLVGVPSSTGIIVKGRDFEQQIDNLLSQCNYRNAEPISYSLMDMDGNSLGIESMTDHFTVRQCTPAQDIWTLSSAYAIINTGHDGKNDDSYFSIYLLPKDGKSGAFNNIPRDQKLEVNSNSTLTLPLGGNGTVGSNAIPLNGFMRAAFNNGGSIMLQLAAAPLKNDDWDITSLTVKLDFVSQKGTHWQPSPLVFNNIRLSSGHDQTFFFDNNFNPIQ